tara:strand:- start:46 stop:996 length:951 start_codon:yes stop_codon:yes gene_type:complete
MKFKELSQTDVDFIKQVYLKIDNREECYRVISKEYGIKERSVRNWAVKLGIGGEKVNSKQPSKILVYDIETSRGVFKAFWTGKQYLGYKAMVKEPSIISISWKWLGNDKIHHLTWDKNHSDKEMVKSFLIEYNKADMLIGQNNDNFDNRWVQARAMKYGFDFNTYLRSFDIMKQNKKLFRVVSYSMDYTAKFLNVTFKQSHEGIKMWDMIEDGTKEEQKEYLQKMVDYNVGDIITTEEIYLKNRKYYGHKTHFGVLNGGEKYTCPNCGTLQVELYKTSITPAGTIQRIMRCKIDGVKYKLTNKQYIAFLDYKIKEL